MNLLWVFIWVGIIQAMNVNDDSSRHHHMSHHEQTVIQGTIVNNTDKPYVVDLSFNKKESNDSDNIIKVGYTTKFLALSNAATALLSAAVSSGVTIAILWKKCG